MFFDTCQTPSWSQTHETGRELSSFLKTEARCKVEVCNQEQGRKGDQWKHCFTSQLLNYLTISCWTPVLCNGLSTTVKCFCKAASDWSLKYIIVCFARWLLWNVVQGIHFLHLSQSFQKPNFNTSVPTLRCGYLNFSPLQNGKTGLPPSFGLLLTKYLKKIK